MGDAMGAISRFSTLEDDIRRRTTETERYLQQNPGDVQTWISYSTLHLKLSPDLTGKTSSGLVDSAKMPQTHANAEITLAILGRALEAHADNMASPSLHLAYLRAAEAFWPPAKVTERWKNVLRELSNRGGPVVAEGIMQVRLGYIDWREGQGFRKSADGRDGIGGVDEVIEVYVDGLASLRESKYVDGRRRYIIYDKAHFTYRCQRAGRGGASGILASDGMSILKRIR